MKDKEKAHKNQEIERLRAIAVMLVVFAHSSFFHPALPVCLRFGFTGVDLFFVISGYVVSFSLFRIFDNIKSNFPLIGYLDFVKRVLCIFYTKRFFRIMPAAIFWIIIYFVLAVFFENHPSASLFGTPYQLFIESLYFLSGTYNYIIQFWGFPVQYLGHYWSLTVEEHFYFILPWILLIFKSYWKRFFTIFGGVILVAIVLRPMIAVPTGWVDQSFYFFSSHRRFDALFVGVLIALFTSSRGYVLLEKTYDFTSIKLNPYILKIVNFGFTIACIFVLWASPSWLSEGVRTGLGFCIYELIACILVLLASMEKGIVLNLPVIKNLLQHIGSRSYAIYLSHTAAISLWIALSNPLRPSWIFDTDTGRWLQMIILMFIVLTFSQITYYLIEIPFIRLGNRVCRNNHDK